MRLGLVTLAWWLLAQEPAPSPAGGGSEEPPPPPSTAASEAPEIPSTEATGEEPTDAAGAGDEEPEGHTETAPYVVVSPGVLQAPWGFRTNYQWGAGAGAWFQERRSTGSIGVFFGHVLGWKDSHILRVGAQVHAGRLFAYGLLEPKLVARIGYTALLHGNRSHGATLGFALGLDASPDRRRRLVLGTEMGVDLDFFTRFYLYPIVTWRVTVGWRFRPRVVAD